MTYTRMWDASTPLGTRNADEIDDAIREKLLDIQERLNTILGADGDMGDDPVCPAGYDLTSLYTGVGATGSVASVERSIPWYAGHVFNTAGTLTKSLQYVDLQGASATMTIYVPIVVPVGVTITSVQARVFFNSASHTLTGTFKTTKDASDVYSLSLAAPSASASAQWMAGTTPSHLIATAEQTGFLMDFNNNNLSTSTALRLYGVQIKYTHPGGAVR